MVTKITNNFKKDYFVRNLIDTEKSFAKYLADADFNYVIIYKGAVDVWSSDKTPVIYGDETGVLEEVCDEMGNIKDGFEVMTEQDFLINFCYSEIEKYLAKKIKNINYFDGVCYVVFFDSTFNGVVNLNGMTDILSVHYDGEIDGVTFVISNDDDTKQSFASLNEFPIDVIINIVDFIEKNDKPTITPKGFLTDLYDLLVRNTQYITEEEFFDKYIKNDEDITLDTTENGEYYKIEFEKFNLVVVPK